MSKNILIAAGGTGGHLFPAMAVADELIRKTGGEYKIHFIGTENRIESKKVPKAGFQYTSMPVKAFPGKNLKAINWFLEFRKSQKIAQQVIQDFEIDALICAGAYLSVPPGYAAAKEGIPIFLMESNVNLGKAHKMLLEKSDKIFISWEETKKEFDDKSKVVLTGNPVRKDIAVKKEKALAKKELGFNPEKPLLLIIGGSLGAKAINENIQRHLSDIISQDISVVWQTGGSFDEVVHRGSDLPDNVRKVNFIDDMSAVYSAADLVVSRSGATAVSEICVVGVPSILIPLPSAANNEQYHNAKTLADNKAAILIPEKTLNGNLMTAINNVLSNADAQKLMSNNAQKLARPKAAELIAKHIIDQISI
jgi:UDP-N-acetylglucosamine--N-acetylmuramyl-(pentapeptide) pyrophosphoryl-undecaprenol N-acetylglucosamine transferase